MALVVLLRGVNVGGYRTFRPTALADALKHLDAVNIGAAGTFVIRTPVSRTELRAELRRRLPFETTSMICDGQDIVKLATSDPFSTEGRRPDIVRFVSVLSRAPRTVPPTPMSFPPTGSWLLKILGRDHRFIYGLYRRQMRAIRYLGMMDRIFGVPATTRNWNTITAVAKVLKGGTRFNIIAQSSDKRR